MELEGASVLVFDNISKRYGDVIALDGATFKVERARILGFLGPNGGRQDVCHAVHLRSDRTRRRIDQAGCPPGHVQRPASVRSRSTVSTCNQIR